PDLLPVVAGAVVVAVEKDLEALGFELAREGIGIAAPVAPGIGDEEVVAEDEVEQAPPERGMTLGLVGGMTGRGTARLQRGRLLLHRDLPEARCRLSSAKELDKTSRRALVGVAARSLRRIVSRIGCSENKILKPTPKAASRPPSA